MDSGSTSLPTAPSTAVLGRDKFGNFMYCIGISVAILLLLLFTIILVSCLCIRAHRREPDDGDDEDDDDVERGLADSTLKSWPTVTYSEARRRDRLRAFGGCCSVCLADYGNGGEELRLMPDCGHLFHARCVDEWLRRKPTCPVCRSSPVPSPMPTPLLQPALLSAWQH
ncbi:hypothetical protein HPP92_011044 [Vanilla planifolia]|uniref:RING-type domain-containing protein n=1 Tax=Vanilla planifolia TaxID=51239 RepID=A0A835QUZ5_VANPL|nr:hypothetical protein HPP92_011044 [Vanilla planifolia]